MDKWLEMSVDELEQKLNTSATDGLSHAEANIRIDEQRRNGIKNRSPLYCPRKSNVFSLILNPVLSIFVILYMTISIFAICNGAQYLGIITLVLLAVNVIILGIGNLIASRTKEKIALYSNPTVKIIRSGCLKYTSSQNIANGDLIIFGAGDIITCDAVVLSSAELSVYEFSCDTHGNLTRKIRDFKNTNLKGESCVKEILYAGSIIVSGTGRAFAIRTSEEVSLYERLNDGAMSGDIKRPDIISRFMEQARKICVIASLALVFMAFAGMVTLNNKNFSEILLLLLSSVLYISSNAIDLWSKIIFKSSIDRLSDGIVVKKNRVIDVMTLYSDIVLLGRAGITDGKLHVSSVFLSGRRLDYQIIKSKPDRTYRLCEYIYTYLMATSTMECHGMDFYKRSLEDFMSDMEFDTEGANLKINSQYYITDDVSSQNSYKFETKITISQNSSVVSKCRLMSVGDMVVPIDQTIQKKIFDYVDACESCGEKLVFVISNESDGHEKSTLEGIISFEEHIVDDMCYALERCRQMGICITSFMFEESAENINYLMSCGLISSSSDKSIAFASEFRKLNKDITANYGKYNVYLGFDVSDYSKLLNHMKKVGKTIVSYGVDNKFSGIMALSDISVTCNNIKYDSKEYLTSMYESFPECGDDNSQISSQKTRAMADLLVERSQEHGGISGILDAANAVSSGYINFAYFLKYVLFAVMSFFVLSFSTVLSGVAFINTSQMLISYLFVICIGLYAFSNNIPVPGFFEKKERNYIAFPKALLKTSVVKVIIFAGGLVLYSIIAFLLTIFGVLNVNDVSFVTFVGLSFVSIYRLISYSREYSNENSRSKYIKILIFIFILLIFLIFVLSLSLFIADKIFQDEQYNILLLLQNISNVLYGECFDALSFILLPIFVCINILSNITYSKISKVKKYQIAK